MRVQSYYEPRGYAEAEKNSINCGENSSRDFSKPYSTPFKIEKMQTEIIMKISDMPQCKYQGTKSL